MDLSHFKKEPEKDNEARLKIEVLNQFKQKHTQELNTNKLKDRISATSQIDLDELAFYDKMRDIMNKPRLTQNSLDKMQMFEIVDKHRNNLHSINLDKECEKEEKELGFSNFIR